MACGCQGKKAALPAPGAGETYYALESPGGTVETFSDLTAAREAKAAQGGTVRIVRSS